MSLINDMLKNLEKRQAPNKTVPPLTLRQFDDDEESSFDMTHIMLIAGGLIVCAMIAGVAWYFVSHKTLHPVTILNKQQVAVTQRVPPDKEQIWIKPVSISGITQQLKGSITEIIFMLDHVALYRITSNEEQNQIAVTIDQSELQSELPQTNYLNSAVSNITSQKIGNDTKFVLTLNPGATVKYINLTNDNKSPELIVAIDYPVGAGGSLPSTNNASIKTPAMQNMIAEQYRLALNEAENGRYTLAMEQLDALLKADPDFKQARVSLAALLIEHGNRWKAKQYLDEGLSSNPNYAPFVELKARTMTLEGKITQALALLQSAIPSIEENPEYHAFMAALYERTNNNAIAARIYRQLVNLNPHNGNWWFGLGISLEKTGQIRDAVNAYTNAMAAGKLNSNSIIYLQNRLRVLQEEINEKG